MPNSARPMEDVYSKPGHLFRRMQQIAVAIFREECKGFDVTPVQYAALVAVREFPGIDATRLSDVIAFDRSTLGAVIDRLENKGYVEREGAPRDKRVKLLYLTRAGAHLLKEIIPAVDRAQARMLKPLNATDRKKLMTLMAQLVHLNNEESRAPLRAQNVVEHFGSTR